MLRNAWITVILAAVAVGCLWMPTPAASDVLLIEEVRERMRRDLPSNGLDKQEVEQRYGVPNERHAPVGEPPITRWVYDGYSVYFEHDLVIESVLHRGAVLERNASGP